MFGSILLIVAYILIICEFIWYFTCTEHEDVPLIAMIVLFLLGLIPGLNVIMFFVNIEVFLMMNTESDITLKNNWFNRKFLAHHDE